MNTHFIIRGFGHYAPKRVLTNADLEKIVETTDEWITTRTGIKERHIVAEGETSSDMGLEAARKALAAASMEASDLTHIVFATFTPDYVIPSAACVLQEKLGISGQMCLDVQAACSGFLYAMETARGYLALHPQSKILVVASEALTSRVNWEDRATCVLFGDAAGAAVLTAGDADETPRVVDIMLGADGALGDLLTVRGGGSAIAYKLGQPVGEEYFVEFLGREVFKHAVRHMTGISEAILARHGLTNADVDVLVPHQANYRIIDAVGRKLEVPVERVFSNVDRYGNTSAASVPVALSEALDLGVIKPGHRVLVPTFGGGFTWGAMLLQF